MRRLLRSLLIAGALAVVPSALAAVELKDVDASGYPTMRVTVVAPSQSTEAPALTEDGRPVVGFSAQNLARAKSVALAVDTSQSMRGKALADAIAAARSFVAAKPPADRIALTVFGSDAVTLTDFSTATIDADTALRTLAVDDEQGTALYDAIAVAAQELASEPLPARIIIVLTDGRDVSSSASFEEAIVAAREAGVAVYPIGIEGPQFSPETLLEIARETGGTYYGAASSATLEGVYSSIAEELRRTWQLEYVTAARPGERLTLEATVAGGESGTAQVTTPGIPAPPVSHPKPSSLLPPVLLESGWGSLAVGLAAGVIVLLAAALAFSPSKGSWVRARLQPHLGMKRRGARRRANRERFALAAALFRATEKALEEKRVWRKLERKLERADIPLRTVEFAYLMAGCGLGLGILTAVAGLPSLLVLAAMPAGALLPYGFVAMKAQRRLRTFENQLPDLLVTMAASLKAGHSFRQGMQTVVDEGAEPASREFKRVLTETQLGRPIEDALSEMAERIGSKNFAFVVQAVNIQRQVGGSLAGLFDMVAETVRNRQQFQRKVRGLTAMGRASAYVLIGLPFAIAGMITVVNSEYMSPLFHTATGHKLIFLTLGMMGFGSLILKKIVSFRS